MGFPCNRQATSAGYSLDGIKNARKNCPVSCGTCCDKQYPNATCTRLEDGQTLPYLTPAEVSKLYKVPPSDIQLANIISSPKDIKEWRHIEPVWAGTKWGKDGGIVIFGDSHCMMYGEILSTLAEEYQRPMAFLCSVATLDDHAINIGHNHKFNFLRHYLKDWNPDVIATLFSHSYDIDDIPCTCDDDRLFEDQQGYTCQAWSPVSCTEDAALSMGYTIDGLNKAKLFCPKSCGTCTSNCLTNFEREVRKIVSTHSKTDIVLFGDNPRLPNPLDEGHIVVNAKNVYDEQGNWDFLSGMKEQRKDHRSLWNGLYMKLSDNNKNVKFADIAPFFMDNEENLQIIDPVTGKFAYRDCNHLNRYGVQRLDQLFRWHIFGDGMCKPIGIK